MAFEGQWPRADSGARNPSRRRPPHREDAGGGRSRVGGGVLLLGRKQCDARGHPAQAQHGHPRCRAWEEGHPGDDRRAHPRHAAEESAPCRPWDHGTSYQPSRLTLFDYDQWA